MFSGPGMDQTIAPVEIAQQTTTDDALPLRDTSTGQADEQTKQQFIGWPKAVSIMAVALFGATTTPIPIERHNNVPFMTEQPAEVESSVAPALSEIADRYESVFFSYPARVLDVERNTSGDPMLVTVLVSVDGNDVVLKRAAKQFRFEVKPDMRLVADGVVRGGTKQLAFRMARPLQLNEEQEQLLEQIVSAFKS